MYHVILKEKHKKLKNEWLIIKKITLIKKNEKHVMKVNYEYALYFKI